MNPCYHYDCGLRNNAGYCKATVCINPNYATWQTNNTDNKSLKVKPVEFDACISCLICNESIPLPTGSKNYYQICPECKKRLYSLLYPEKRKEEEA